MDVFDQLTQKKKFTGPLIQAFVKEFGDSFYKALEKLESKNLLVHKYCFFPSNYTLWVVQGEKHPYIVYPNLYCECKAFLMTAMYRKKKYTPCKHLLAQRIADILCG